MIALDCETVARFRAQVAAAGEAECWEWLGLRDVAGYGLFRVQRDYRRRAYRATHIALALGGKGWVPKGRFALHSCDNPPCVNPAHLRVGTARENTRDMYERGRTKNLLPGENHQNAKLANADVVEIKRRLRAGELHGTIARDYGVTEPTISGIRRGKTWAHVGGRVRKWRGGKPGDRRGSLRGENHPRAKLTAETAREVVRLLQTGAKQRDIAARFGLSESTISRIKKGYSGYSAPVVLRHGSQMRLM